MVPLCLSFFDEALRASSIQTGCQGLPGWLPGAAQSIEAL